MPHIEGNLVAIPLREHIVGWPKFALIHRAQLCTYDLLRAVRDRAQRRIHAYQNPCGKRKCGQSKREQQKKVVSQIAPPRLLLDAGRVTFDCHPSRRCARSKFYGRLERGFRVIAGRRYGFFFLRFVGWTVERSSRNMERVIHDRSSVRPSGACSSLTILPLWLALFH